MSIFSQNGSDYSTEKLKKSKDWKYWMLVYILGKTVNDLITNTEIDKSYHNNHTAEDKSAYSRDVSFVWLKVYLLITANIDCVSV